MFFKIKTILPPKFSVREWQWPFSNYYKCQTKNYLICACIEFKCLTFCRSSYNEPAVAGRICHVIACPNIRSISFLHIEARLEKERKHNYFSYRFAGANCLLTVDNWESLNNQTSVTHRGCVVASCSVKKCLIAENGYEMW